MPILRSAVPCRKLPEGSYRYITTLTPKNYSFKLEQTAMYTYLAGLIMRQGDEFIDCGCGRSIVRLHFALLAKAPNQILDFSEPL
jgi:hypothetical protein